MYLVCDRILWKNFDFGHIPLSAEEITRRFRYVNDRTTHVTVRGLTGKYPLDKWNNNTITAKMLERLIDRCPKLQSLSVHEAFLNFQKVSIKCYSKIDTNVFSNLEIALDEYSRLSEHT